MAEMVNYEEWTWQRHVQAAADELRRADNSGDYQVALYHATRAVAHAQLADQTP